MEIAEVLNAKLQGDDDEVYLIREIKDRPWWRLWA
jgi:hypothetical protein